MMNVATTSFLDEFNAAAVRAQAAETQYRHEAARRIAQLEQERAFAFRRLNLLTALAVAVARAENDENSIEDGSATLRERLNWSTVDDTRSEVLACFTPVLSAISRAIRRPEDGAPSSVSGALAGFEAWYLEQRSNAFWMLFEQELPELPLVEV